MTPSWAAWRSPRSTGGTTAAGCPTGRWRRRKAGAWPTAAARAISEWAFTDLGLFRLELGHRTDNLASCKVATRAGYAVEGVERAKLRYRRPALRLRNARPTGNGQLTGPRHDAARRRGFQPGQETRQRLRADGQLDLACCPLDTATRSRQRASRSSPGGWVRVGARSPGRTGESRGPGRTARTAHRYTRRNSSPR